MKKRVLSALLAGAIALSLAVPALAAVPSTDEAAQVLAALDIMVGDENGDLSLTAPVTRAEFVKMLMAASPISVGDETYVSPYPDVPRTHWAAPYVEAAVSSGYVTGYLDGTFRPNATITLAEGVVMVLRLLGYSNSDFSGSFPAGQMAMYRTLDLDEGITLGQNDTMTRQDAMYLFYNALTASTKAGQPYLSSVLGHSLTADGQVDTLALLNDTMDGPVVVGESGWRDKIPFDIDGAKVSRNGMTATSSALAQNDVVYWSKSMNTLWVYTNRVTGTIQAVSPASSPISITLSGRQYEIETSSAAYAVSDLGSFSVGDSATLLLGRDNKVVSVLSPAQSTGTVYGMVVAVQPQSYTDANGNDFSASSLTIAATDGNTYTYRYDEDDIRVGAYVLATSDGGETQVRRLSSSSLSGRVDSAGTKLGSRSFAPDVEILDTYGDTMAVRVYPNRLAGMTLTESQVAYYLLDGDGDISRLILRDATGDMHTYGVIDSVSETNAGLTTMGTYVYQDAAGTHSLSGNRIYALERGPFMMKSDGGQVDRAANLEEVEIASVEGSTAYAGNRELAIWDGVQVYEVRDDDYYPSSLSIVSNGGYTLTGYYDKDQSQGGRIRVILAEEA